MVPTTNPETILQRIRDLKNRPQKVRKQFHPPQRWNFASRNLLCFDQSLNNCGWAFLSTEGPWISVTHSGVIRPPKIEEEGFEGTLVKSVHISDGVDQVIRDNLGAFDQVVCEMPAVYGYRTESSLVALVTIVRTMATLELGLPVLVSRQQAASALCGSPGATKQESGALVDRLVGERHCKPWNEHVRDAVFVGLRHLHAPLDVREVVDGGS